jgi:lipopolysaccharide export LptBFGC system permease protein LptF
MTIGKEGLIWLSRILNWVILIFFKKRGIHLAINLFLYLIAVNLLFLFLYWWRFKKVPFFKSIFCG